MKKYIWVVLLILIAALLFYLIWNWSGKVADDNEKCAMANAKADQFQKALDKFGAFSPSDAAMLWSEGVKTRNGALQYAVMSAELKAKYTALMNQNSSAWVTGYSSPWVTSYELIESKRISKGEYELVMQFELATSSGSEGKHLAKLAIVNEDQLWVINSVKADEEMMGLTGLETN